MFNRLETVWNSHTPVYLHNRTKENFIFQLTLTGVIIGGWYAYDVYKERRRNRKQNRNHLRAVI